MPTDPFHYKVGDVHPSGEKIAFIYGESPDVFVYEDAHGRIQWDVRADQLSPSQQAVQNAFDRLAARRVLWIPKGTQSVSKEEMRQNFFLALCENDTNKALAHLDSASAHIDAEVLSQAKISYLKVGFNTAISMLLFAAILALAADKFGVLAPANKDDVPILVWVALSIAGGAFGSWTSLLQRTPKLSVTAVDVPSSVMFQSAYRIILGATFGLVALLALKTNLLAATFLSNLWQFSLLTFISGFSERFIPELLKRAEGTVSATSRRNPSLTSDGKGKGKGDQVVGSADGGSNVKPESHGGGAAGATKEPQPTPTK